MAEQLPRKFYSKFFPYKIGEQLAGSTIVSMSTGGTTTRLALADGRQATYRLGSDTEMYWALSSE